MKKLFAIVALSTLIAEGHAEEFDPEQAQRVADVFNHHNMIGMQASYYYCTNGHWPKLWQELKELPCQFESCKSFRFDWNWIESSSVDHREDEILIIQLPNRDNEPATEFLVSVLQPPACIFGKVLSNIHIGPWGRAYTKPMLDFSDDA